MGYTHYWNYDKATENKDAQFDALVRDTRRIIDLASLYGVRLGDGLGRNEPLFMFDYFALNGVTGEDCESFVWTREPEGYSFCKTGHNNYDIIVTAILIRAKYHYGDAVKIESDGTWDDWQQGAGVCETLFFDDVVCPFEKEVSK